MWISAKVNSGVCGVQPGQSDGSFLRDATFLVLLLKIKPHLHPPITSETFNDQHTGGGRTNCPQCTRTPLAKTPTNIWSLKDKKSVKRGLVINEQKYIICWLCSSRKEKMTAINIISVGVNCPELTPPKASWQTDGRRGDLQFSPSDLGHLLYYDHQSSKTEQNDTFCQSKVGFPWRLPPQRWLVLPYVPFNFPLPIVE